MSCDESTRPYAPTWHQWIGEGEGDESKFHQAGTFPTSLSADFLYTGFRNLDLR